jgi:hypothetical protein
LRGGSGIRPELQIAGTPQRLDFARRIHGTTSATSASLSIAFKAFAEDVIQALRT